MKFTNILYILNPQLEELNPMINSVMQVLKGGIFGFTSNLFEMRISSNNY